MQTPFRIGVDSLATFEALRAGSGKISAFPGLPDVARENGVHVLGYSCASTPLDAGRPITALAAYLGQFSIVVSDSKRLVGVPTASKWYFRVEWAVLAKVTHNVRLSV
ncbi:MAG: hypothetical protein ACRDSO_00655 [Pseudonocardiaceae bacterium]